MAKAEAKTKAKRKMSAKQKANIKKLAAAGKVCRKHHEPFTKAFGTCMSQQFEKAPKNN